MRSISCSHITNGNTVGKCAAHTSNKDPVSRGNMKADAAAKLASQKPQKQLLLNLEEELTLYLFKDMQNSVALKEQTKWTKKGVVKDRGLWK